MIKIIFVLFMFAYKVCMPIYQSKCSFIMKLQFQNTLSKTFHGVVKFGKVVISIICDYFLRPF